MKLLIIVPAFNEDQVIARTLSNIKRVTSTYKDKQIVVIDDGSTDKTALRAKAQRVTVLRHFLNRGLGGALGTGLVYAKLNSFDAAVTIDADGQHSPSDIHKILQPIIVNQADIVIGSRSSLSDNQLPLDRSILILLSNILTFMLTGIKTSDSQSGFRAFNRQAIAQIDLKTQRMEASTELFSEVSRLNLRLAQVPIKVIYTPYSRAKGQKNTNALAITYKLFLRLFR